MVLFKGALLFNKLPNKFKEANSLYISKTTLKNAHGGHVLILSACFLLKMDICKKKRSPVRYLCF